MKVAVSASGITLDSMVDPRFGRCLYFAIVDTESMYLNAYPNANAGLQGGAGIQAARFLAEQDVGAVLTGRCGPNAALALEAAGVGLYEGQGGISVREAIEKYKKGELTAISGDPSQPSAGNFCGPGMGRGYGRGAGARGNVSSISAGRSGMMRGNGPGRSGKMLGSGGNPRDMSNRNAGGKRNP